MFTVKDAIVWRCQACNKQVSTAMTANGAFLACVVVVCWTVMIYVWHLVYIGFGGLIDGYSALCVVYEVSLEVVMTTRAWCAGDAGIAIWRARLFGAQLDSGRLIKADVKAILGWKHMHSWIELSLYICITQRETYRILMIMLNMRQMDLSSEYM